MIHRYTTALLAAAALALPAAAQADATAKEPAQRPEGPKHVDMSLLDGPHHVLMKTSEGSFILELEPEKAPVSTANFLQYVRDGFYEGTIFHRVIDNFMVQGGGFTEAYYDFRPTPGMRSIPENVEKAGRDPIPNEARKAGLENDPYTIAYARTNDPNSATSQFFINVADNRFLDPGVRSPEDAGYAVFGRVIAGKETIDRIRAVPVQPDRLGGQPSEPVDPVVIEGAAIITEQRAKELADRGLDADQPDDKPGADKPETR